ncbi:MAG: acyltransferase family protein, partial [Cyanobacteria bacterium J06623_7]
MTGKTIKLKYRGDIDGLRAISCLAVMLFHAKFAWLGGGYVGVDVFFVISGYLTTSIVFNQVKTGKFNLLRFYQKRAARLLPALILMFVGTAIFGFLFYDNRTLDNFGQQVVYGAFGAANILFAQGDNYFVSDEALTPLIHLWSLGVEEQFYLVWPLVLAAIAWLNVELILGFALVLFTTSLTMSAAAVETLPIQAYFYTHYRAFEMLVGAMVALGLRSAWMRFKPSLKFKELLSWVGLALIVVPMVLFDNTTSFPGFNALYPCVGTALLICCGEQTRLAKVLSLKPLIFIGLISYPLYLYHQPLISYCHFFGLELPPLQLFLVVAAISFPLAWATYRYVETPIRGLARQPQGRGLGRLLKAALASLCGLALMGLLFAKSNGLEQRFTLLNPYALEISESMSPSFYQFFKQGLRVAPADSGKVLFVGDSVLQQYVYPISQALDIEPGEVDTVTRGGCVLLKEVELIDRYQTESGISCDRLRQQLYQSEKQYDYIFISQSWISYEADLLNAPVKAGSPGYTLNRWSSFIDETVEHFQPLAQNLVIIGGHPIVEGTSQLQPTLFSNPEAYAVKLGDLEVVNDNHLAAAREFFTRWQDRDRVAVIAPEEIWASAQSQLHDGNWSFFENGLHISQASTDYVVQRLQKIPEFFRLTQN